MSADPLSYFAINDDDDDDKSDNSEKNEGVELSGSNKNILGDDTTKINNLPPPLEVLADAKTPEFVMSHLTSDLDWNKMVKEAPYVPPKEFKPWENALPAVESKSLLKSKKPDLTIVKGTAVTLTKHSNEVKPKKDTSITINTKDHAVTWSKMYNHTNFALSKKRPLPEDEDADLVGFCHTNLNDDKIAYQSKNQKMSDAATFRLKEKRKRDVGQANRDKSFVEEEKRILKQNYD